MQTEVVSHGCNAFNSLPWYISFPFVILVWVVVIAFSLLVYGIYRDNKESGW